MDYTRFKSMLALELPINRKERFYTATILPSLLFHNGLSNLFQFLKQIKNFPATINEENTGDNFLFYTEYNLKESAGKKSVGAEILTPTRDTPDVIIQILEPRVFVIIEGKMFENLPQSKLDKQMKAQKVAVIDMLKKSYKLDDDQMFHIALTPEALGFHDTIEYQVINWEFFKTKSLNIQGNYFYNFLIFALDNYPKLVGDKFWQASTVKGYKTGQDIYQDGKEQQQLWVGRKGGKSKLLQDITQGKWKNREYCYNTEEPPNGQKGNWVSSEEFMTLVEKNERNGG